ncbi:MAG: protein-L-isoaspartate O-methyltransferase [Arenicellales bacterium]|nr:protein-L-isoaspartate O-methyltransferase [Arenicellales bacterium]MDP6790653.1 protein-L-isoaspartate O-methyltransferase [Arenicellales bacterium]MDP6918693.1 protein-L-isoaspartate O-methyltransferase [Arenicellales bacterium]
MDIEHARFNMIEQQIRPWGVLDSGILSVLQSVGRETFVPPDYRHLAFADIEIPIGHGQTMLEPKLEARLLQALAPQPDDNILEIGTGSGYMTALLSRTGARVTTVEIYPDLLASAADALAAAGISNVSLEQGDASAGWAPGAVWDAVLLTASVPELPAAFTNGLAVNGRLVAVVGSDPAMEALRVRRGSGAALSSTSLFDTCLAPLVNAHNSRVFQL